MNKEEQQKELSKMVIVEPKYLMGTQAFHQLGELSREEFDLFAAVAETEKFWIGSWVEGFGFFNVLFPKEKCRTLTEEEITKYNGMYLRINSGSPYKLKIS